MSIKENKQTWGKNKMINLLLFVLFFILSYLLITQYIIYKKTERYKKKNNLKLSTKAHFFKELFSKINFLKAKEDFLSKQGNPLNLNVSSYYLSKIALALFLFVIANTNYGSLLIAILFGAVGYFFVDTYIFINKKTRDGEVCTDLLNVTDSIILQLSAEVSLKESLKRQFENCKNKDFKKAMLEFSTQYELSELNINVAIEELKNKFDILEINMFCNVLREYNKVGNIIEILENLSEMLRVKYIEKLKSATRTKVLYITFGVIVALGNIIMLTFYPLFISIGNGFNTIFT